jgi:CubicO group peptidase (beta-lactamase class C family)
MDFSELDNYLEKLIAEAGIPGAAICVNMDGKTVRRRAFGIRDQKGTPVDDNTIFGIASMSKGLTCAALAILEAEGRVSFYDPAVRFFPRLHLRGVPRESLLLHHLASHTSGLPPLPLMAWSLAWHTPDLAWTRPEMERWRQGSKSHVNTLEDIVDYISEGDYSPLGQPGEVISYSNDCFALLSSVADMVAGIPLEEFLRRRIFEPLNMSRTVLDQDGKEAMKLGNTTRLFYKTENGFEASDNWDIAPPYRGAGWVKSTPSDMARFYETLCGDGLFRGRRIMPPGCASLMYGVRFPESPLDNCYGYGLEKRPFRGHTIVEHAGGLSGIASKGGFIKGSNGYSAVVCCNWGDAAPGPLINGIYNYLLGAPLGESHLYWETLPQGPAEPEFYAGRYHTEEPFYHDLVVELRNKTLYSVDAETGEAYPLVFCGRTCFIVRKPGQRPDCCPRLIFRPRGEEPSQVRVGNRVFTRIGA